MTDSTMHWDVVVVGAGPAGSIVARQLAINGSRVLLADKSHFPRHKVCGSCLNDNALSALRHAGLDDLPSRLGAVPLDHVELRSHRRSSRLPLAGGVSLSRWALDAALIDEAIAAGAEVRTGVRVSMQDVHGNRRRLTLHVGRNAISATASVIIAADGLNGRLATSTESVHIARGSRIGAGAILPSSPVDLPPGRLVMAVGKRGYVGMVRLESDQVDLAAAFDPAFVREAGGLPAAARMVLEEAGNMAVPDIDTADWRGTPSLTQRPASIAGPRWFAVGDAAGYVEPFTGEGMAWAINGALALAPIVGEAVERWNDGFMTTWALRHRRLIGRRQFTCRVLSRVLRSPVACRVTFGMIRRWPGVAGPVVRQLHRPSMLAPQGIL